MFSRVATTLVILALVGGSAFADAKMGGVAREIAMGGSGFGGIAFNPYIWNDPTVQYINPAFQGMYKDYGWSNFGGGSVAGLNSSNDGFGAQHGGANFSFGDKLAVGTLLSYDPSGLNTLIASMPLVGGGYVSGFTTVSPAEVLEFVGSYSLGSINVGLGVMYGWTGQDATDTTGRKSELSGTVIGFRGGATFEFGSGSMVEGSLAYRSSSADDKSDTVSAEGSLTELVFAARGKLRVNNKVNFIPVVGFASGSGDVTYPTSMGELSLTALAIGAGAEITYSSLYLAGGLSYAMVENEVTLTVPPAAGNTTTTTATGFPVLNLGGEWWFTDWLAGRAGYFRAFTNVKTENPNGFIAPNGIFAGETNFSSGTSIVSVGGYTNDDLVVFGLAARFGNFGLETTVSEEALRRGFGVIGGGSDNINAFGYFTANWNFE